MGPSFAAADFCKEFGNADYIKVILYSSLAKTGKGHGTDRAIAETLSYIKNKIIFDTVTKTDVHSNTVEFVAYKDNLLLGRKLYYSIGGGEILTAFKIFHTMMLRTRN